MDDNDYTMYHSYHHEFLRDFLKNYDEYIRRKDPLDDLSVESQIETEYLKLVERLH